MLIYVKYYKNNQFRLTFLLSLPFSLSNSLILFWYSSFNSSSALSYFYSISMAFILVYFSFITASFNFSSSCLTFHWFSSLNVLDLESAVLLSRIFSTLNIPFLSIGWIFLTCVEFFHLKPILRLVFPYQLVLTDLYFTITSFESSTIYVQHHPSWFSIFEITSLKEIHFCLIIILTY